MVFPVAAAPSQHRRTMLRRLNEETNSEEVCTEWQSLATPTNTDSSVPSFDAVAFRISTRGRQGVTLGALDVTLRQEGSSSLRNTATNSIRIEILASDENYELVLNNPSSWRTIADTEAVIMGQRALVPAQVFQDISLSRLDEQSLIIRVYSTNEDEPSAMESTVDAFVKRNEVALEGTHINVFAGTPLTPDGMVDPSTSIAPLLQTQFYYQRDNSCQTNTDDGSIRKTTVLYLEQRIFDSQRLLSLSEFEYDSLEDSIGNTMEQLRQSNGFNWTIPEITTTNQACYNTGSPLECQSLLVSVQIRQTLEDTPEAAANLPLEAVMYQNTQNLAQHFQGIMPGSQYIGFRTIRARLTVTLPVSTPQSTLLNDVQREFVQDTVVEYFRGTLPEERLRLYQWDITQQRFSSNGIVLQGTLWGSATLQKEEEIVTRVEGLVKDNPSELWRTLQFYAQTPGPIQLDNHYEWFLNNVENTDSTASMTIDEIYGSGDGGDTGLSMTVLVPIILGVVFALILGCVYFFRRRNFMGRMDYDRAQKRREKNELENWKDDGNDGVYDDDSGDDYDENWDEEKQNQTRRHSPKSDPAQLENGNTPETGRTMKRIPSAKSLPEDSSSFMFEEGSMLRRSASWSTLESPTPEQPADNRPLKTLFEKFMDRIDPTPVFDDEVELKSNSSTPKYEESNTALMRTLSRTSSGKSLQDEKSLKRTSSSKSLSRKNSNMSLNGDESQNPKRTSKERTTKRSKSADIDIPSDLNSKRVPRRSKSSDIVSLPLNDTPQSKASSSKSASKRALRRSKSSDAFLPTERAKAPSRSKSSDVSLATNFPSRRPPRRTKSSDGSPHMYQRPLSQTPPDVGNPPFDHRGPEGQNSPPKRRRPPGRSKSYDEGMPPSNRTSPSKNLRPTSEIKRRPHLRSRPRPSETPVRQTLERNPSSDPIMLSQQQHPTPTGGDPGATTSGGDHEDMLHAKNTDISRRNDNGGIGPSMSVSERKAALMRAQQAQRGEQQERSGQRPWSPKNSPTGNDDADDTVASTSLSNHSSSHHQPASEPPELVGE